MTEVRDIAASVLHSPGCVQSMDEWDQALYTEHEKHCSCDREERLVAAGLAAAMTAEQREVLAEGYKALSARLFHLSECATSCAPAEIPGPCDCAAILLAR